MAWDFHVGQKVVCVDAPKPLFTKWKATDFFVPIIGQVYTLRDVFIEDRYANAPVILYVRLCEIQNKSVETYTGPYEPAFGASHFRPLLPRKTNISIFTAMLNPQRQSEDA
jgi:hypothetical protein